MLPLIAPIVTILVGGLQVTSALSLDPTDATSIEACSQVVASNLLKSWYTFNNTDQTQVGIFNLVSWEWWLSGGAWTALQDYQSYTGDTKWQATTLAAIGEQSGPNYDFLPSWESSSEANDDQAYWVFNALTALEYGFPALQCPSEQASGNCSNSYLRMADNAFNEYVARWESTGITTCNGGLKWQFTDAVSGYYYKNTVSNGGFFQLAARLARYTGNRTYSTWANTVWDWTEGVGFISADYNVYDGAGDNNGTNCTVIDKDQWTYNFGSYMIGAASMYNYTNGSAEWSDRVGGLLNTSISNYFQMPSAPGILYESVCETSDSCNIDQLSFKGYLARWMAKTSILVPTLSSQIMPLLQTSAAAAAQACVGPSNNITCGSQWYIAGGDNSSSMPQQLAALETIQSLLISNAPAPIKLNY